MKATTPARKLAEELAAAVTGEQIAAVLRAALAATTTTRAGTVEADHKVRIEASRLLLSYVLGTPIQRSENVTVSLDADSAVGLSARLKNSPALRQSLKAALEDAEGDAVDV